MLEINDRLPSECTDISEVRNEIDNIDKVIIRLLSERFEYVKEVVKYKEKTASSVEASDRRNAAISDRRKWAEEASLNPDVIENIYNTLIDYFIDEGMDEENVMYMGFHASKYNCLAVVRQGELYWHDVNFYVREIEKLGARAWMWADKVWWEPDEYVKHIPKSVLQGKAFKRSA